MIKDMKVKPALLTLVIQFRDCIASSSINSDNFDVIDETNLIKSNMIHGRNDCLFYTKMFSDQVKVIRI